VSEAFPEPTEARADRGEVLVGYLDYFRARVLEKVSALPADEGDVSRLPSTTTAKRPRYLNLSWLLVGSPVANTGTLRDPRRAGAWAVSCRVRCWSPQLA
jgi:hypothetical protein